MIYIPFPRTDLRNHPALLDWINDSSKKDGDWSVLKDFLCLYPRLPFSETWLQSIHQVPKCWYSECFQTDTDALDVEHFRPKNASEPITTASRLNTLRRDWGINAIPQSTSPSTGYGWLRFDYRNYRISTARCNRSGKNDRFPILTGTARLSNPQTPWQTQEYALFLDPTNVEDTRLLLVSPSGRIRPRENSYTPPTDEQLADLPTHWRSPAFNYLRACLTIVNFELNHYTFIAARKEQYENTLQHVHDLKQALLISSNNFFTERAIQELTKMILPSAQFSLAARCAIEAFVPNDATDAIVRQLLDSIVAWVQQRITQTPVDWRA